MAFTRTTVARRYSPSPTPVLDADQRRHMDRELQDIRTAIDALVNAVSEIQDYLETLP